jgi:hypothetical protein
MKACRTGALLAMAALALTGPGCGQTRIVYLEDELPLAAPLEGISGEVAGSGNEREDPPSRVGRLSSLSGTVSVQSEGQEEWAPGVRNLPLMDGDVLWTGADGQVELQVGPTGLRTVGPTSLALLRLEEHTLQLGLEQGTVMVHILPGADRDAVEVATPAGAVTLATPGLYRVDMHPTQPEGKVTVRSGRAEVALEGEVVPVASGQRLLLSGGEAPSYQVEPVTAPTGFDVWGEARQRRASHSPSVQRLGAGVMGAEELDGAGTWRADPALGDVWVPKVASGWAPYREGRWAWVDPWGWTWVDDAPWGFAPSHYGRWAFLAGAWAWVPRARGAAGRPVYAPALVAFVGPAAGPRQDPRTKGGGVAWFPLGPGEPYAPVYPGSKAYAQRLNAWAGPVRAPGAGPWVNQGVPGAVTLVPRATFTAFAAVAPSAVPVDGRWLFRKAPVGSAPALAPTLRSLQRGEGPAGTPAPPLAPRRPLVAVTPLPHPPVSFAARLGALRAGQGRPLTPAAVAALRRQAPAGRFSPPWRRAGERGPGLPVRNRAEAPPVRNRAEAPPVRNRAEAPPVRNRAEAPPVRSGAPSGTAPLRPALASPGRAPAPERRRPAARTQRGAAKARPGGGREAVHGRRGEREGAPKRGVPRQGRK